MKAVRNTWLFWILNFIPQIGIAMLFSVWFTSVRLRIRGVGIWRAIFFLPNLLMPAAVAALFFSLFSFYGPVNQFMVRAGIFPEAMQFLQNPTITRGLWSSSNGGCGLAPVNPDHGRYDLDICVTLRIGHGRWRQRGADVLAITVPLLKPILIYIFVTSLVGGMQMFDIPYLLTDGRGSPSGSIMTNNILMYLKFSSSKGHIGAASAVGVLVFIMTTVCALGIFYFLREKD